MPSPGALPAGARIEVGLPLHIVTRRFRDLDLQIQRLGKEIQDPNTEEFPLGYLRMINESVEPLYEKHAASLPSFK